METHRSLPTAFPAKAGIHLSGDGAVDTWIPAFAGNAVGWQWRNNDWRREMTNDLPVWRSMLFVPVTQRRFVDGAARRGADAIILDLVDSVAPSEKERARNLVPE